MIQMSGITIPTLDEITGHTVMAKLRSLCKRFIGLAEEVDEKIDAPLEEAHLAVQTANATLATAQESLEDAQDAITTANSASQTATEASESAQESAETVGGYDTRLTAVENNTVKLSGAQTINDIKTFNSNILRHFSATGQNAFTIENAQGNSYVYGINDGSKSRGYLNHQCITAGDKATRTLQNVQSPDYDTTAGTGSTATLRTELIPDGRYELQMSRSKGDGSAASVQIAKILANGNVQSGLLDSYAPMVRTTGNQVISGTKSFSMPNYGYSLSVKDEGLDITNITAQRVHTIPFLDKNGVAIANIRYVIQTSGEILFQLELRKTDGTFKYITLGDNS